VEREPLPAAIGPADWNEGLSEEWLGVWNDFRNWLLTAALSFSTSGARFS
jgi:hypothetical protein